MSKFYFLTFIALMFFSCSKKTASFSFNKNEVKNTTVIVNHNEFEMTESQQNQFLDCINGAEYAGIWKGIKRVKVRMIFDNGDTSIVHVMNSVFHSDTNWSIFYNYSCGDAFLNQFVIQSNQIQVEKNYQIMKTIFDDFVEFEDNSDSQNHKDSMTKSLVFFTNQNEITDRELQLIINVWMYYSPTDYDGLHFADQVFYKHKEQSLEAIQNRISNKKEWEDNETAPFSDLLILKDELLISN